MINGRLEWQVSYALFEGGKVFMSILVLSSYESEPIFLLKYTLCYEVLLVWVSFIPCNRILFLQVVEIMFTGGS